jgi:hypothetical protein
MTPLDRYDLALSAWAKADGMAFAGFIMINIRLKDGSFEPDDIGQHYDELHAACRLATLAADLYVLACELREQVSWDDLRGYNAAAHIRP